MFEQALLATPRQSARGATFAVSMGTQATLVAGALLAPMLLIDGPAALRWRNITPPPRFISLAPPERPLLRTSASPRLFDKARLYAPVRIPPKVVGIVEDALPSGPALNGEVGVPGGIGGDASTGLANSLLQSLPKPPPPVPTAKIVENKQPDQARTRIQIGGNVQAAKLVRRVVPLYPVLAKSARVQGTVRLVGIISREGRIMQLQVREGHPLLIPAAVDAVKQWVYQPTLLNGQPVEVIAPIDVHFTLGN
ncbi:MAG: energy transducer TonB [Candidatus Solibacter usitatus]|nr:energy transducer TonB [Candidatus Solibacter usitatus]